ncbi:integrator complex subunit 4-like [Plakobranchus ocellatus]|uniref:Integrator complex subunit 4-like n=1 Tax=Plakobranchus ocellatus TaxID=259542 RepID=A0AAV4C8W7_9GAST|nr:integrator complex subunit 4-like [Plakobranchus ocellatus]
MAAKLKKRALAEFSHVVTEEPQPVKKLRLIHRAAAPVISLNLNSASSAQEILFLLLKFEENLPAEREGAEQIFAELVEHLTNERNSLVRCKIIALFSRLALVTGFSTHLFAEDLLKRVESESSHKVLTQVIATVKDVSQVFPSSSPYVRKFMRSAFKHVSHSSHRVRSACLQLIGCLGACEQQRQDTPASPDWPVSVPEVLTRYIGDSDPRVRCSAFEAMLTLHNGGKTLSFSAYQQACSALADDYEGVRLAAMQQIWVLCHLYPESHVQVGNTSEELRLVDDGFAKICNMVTDISVKVRVKAAQLLGSLQQVGPRFLEQTLDKKLMSMLRGSLQQVGPRFLEQTLDKKLMSMLRKKQSSHERAREHFSSGEWSTGQKWADDAPREDVDPDTVNLLSIGACGAFVHGLEDEFLEVRNASLDSLCELASNSPSFSEMCQDSIIDMFNDEIESVRLNAINSLRKISHNLRLREDQVDIILGVLKDFSDVSREALRNMLGLMSLETKAGLNSCIMALLDNLQKYPQDKASVWRCAQKLGAGHPSHTLALTPDLLCLHPYLDTPEADMDDPAYVTVLVLVFSAAALSPTMVPLFPEHTRRHYQYLRSSLPDLVPVVPGLDINGGEALDRLMVTTMPLSRGTKADAARFLDEMTSRLAGLDENESGSGLTPDPCTRHLLTNMDRIDSSQLQGTHAVVQGALALLRPGPGNSLANLGGVRHVRATLHEPVENLETPVRMAAGLTAGIRVSASIENLVDVRTLRIQVKYPDQQNQLVKPPAQAWTRLSRLRHQLDTEVVMSHALWSESCAVEISLVLEPCGQHVRPSAKKQQDMVEIVPPVKVLVATKPHKL